MTVTRESPSRLRHMSVLAIARVRVLRVLRTGLGFAALLLAIAPWLLVERSTLYARLSALAEFTVVGLTVLAAGAIADDVDSGEYAILRTHGASAIEVIAGGAIASLALSLILVAVQLPIALHGVAVWHPRALLLCMAWLASLLAGWLGMMLLLGTILPGKANAVAMVGLLIAVPVGLATGVLDRLPAVPAALVRSGLHVLPQLDHANAMLRSAVYRTPASPLAAAVLLASPVVYVALASFRLNRLESAGRLTQ